MCIRRKSGCCRLLHACNGIFVCRSVFFHAFTSHTLGYYTPLCMFVMTSLYVEVFLTCSYMRIQYIFVHVCNDIFVCRTCMWCMCHESRCCWSQNSPCICCLSASNKLTWVHVHLNIYIYVCVCVLFCFALKICIRAWCVCLSHTLPLLRGRWYMYVCTYICTHTHPGRTLLCFIGRWVIQIHASYVRMYVQYIYI